jgi:hypothetical protein
MGEAGSPESDLALLASCNHTIFDYGTYGLAVAMFNHDGHTIVYDRGSDEYLMTRILVAGLRNWMKLTN